jgi:ribosomal protein L15
LARGVISKKFSIQATTASAAAVKAIEAAGGSFEKMVS